MVITHQIGFIFIRLLRKVTHSWSGGKLPPVVRSCWSNLSMAPSPSYSTGLLCYLFSCRIIWYDFKLSKSSIYNWVSASNDLGFPSKSRYPETGIEFACLSAHISYLWLRSLVVGQQNRNRSSDFDRRRQGISMIGRLLTNNMWACLAQVIKNGHSALWPPFPSLYSKIHT